MHDLLVLAHRLPYPPDTGDKLRSWHVLKFLSERYRVHLGCFVGAHGNRAHIGKLKALCYETCFIEQAALPACARSLRALLTGEALSLPYYRNGTMGAWVARLLQRVPVTAALVFSAPMAHYLMRPCGVRRVVDFVDLESEKWRQYGHLRRWPLSLMYRREADALLAYERQVALQFERAAFVSPAEAALFGQRAPESRDKAGFYNNGVDPDYFSPHILHRNPFGAACVALVFTGAMDDWGNIEAADWFARQVFAPLHARRPELRFYIVGARPGARVLALGRRPGVVVTGTVPDVRPYLAHAALAVAPLQIARGIQNKVLEAMAMQKIVVASPQALAGIGAAPGAELLVASGAHEFIAQVELALSAASNRPIGMAARARAVSDYSWPDNLARLSQLLDADAREVLP